MKSNSRTKSNKSKEKAKENSIVDDKISLYKLLNVEKTATKEEIVIVILIKRLRIL